MPAGLPFSRLFKRFTAVLVTAVAVATCQSAVTVDGLNYACATSADCATGKQCIAGHCAASGPTDASAPADSGDGGSGAHDSASAQDGKVWEVSGGLSPVCADNANPCKCVNSADLLTAGSDGAATASKAKSCLLTCAMKGQVGPCMSTCMSTDPPPKFSEACASCFGAYGQCVLAHCTGSCLTDPGGLPCGQCLASNCSPGFAICSGWQVL